MNHPALSLAYINSRYIFEVDDRRWVVHINQHQFELDQWLLKHHPLINSWGFLSAVNPGSVILQDGKNMSRHLALGESLCKMGLLHFPGYNQAFDHSWPKELSYWVAGLKPQQGDKIALEWEQNAWVFGSLYAPARLRWVNRR